MNRYIRTDKHGNIVESIVTGRVLGKPWRKLSQKEKEQTLRGIHRFYLADDNVIREKKTIRLVRGFSRFPADGETEMSVSVRGRDLGADETVTISVNGDIHQISPSDHLLFATTEPGEFIVKLIDPRYYSPLKQFSVLAYDPEEDEAPNANR